MSIATVPVVCAEEAPPSRRGSAAPVGVVPGSRGAIRLLGVGTSGGSSPSSDGTTVQVCVPAGSAGLKSGHSEARTGSRMDSIDDDWDIEQPAATDVAALSTADVPRVVAVPTAVHPACQSAESDAGQKSPALGASPTAPTIPLAKQSAAPGTPRASQAPSAGRFSSPLGLGSPPAAKQGRSTSPSGAPPLADEPVAERSVATSVEPAQRQTDNPSAVPAGAPVVSKVRLVAEAFRQKSGAKAPPSNLEAPAFPKPKEPTPAPSVPLATAKSTGDVTQQVTVSPMVELEETLELEEIRSEGITSAAVIAVGTSSASTVETTADQTSVGSVSVQDSAVVFPSRDVGLAERRPAAAELRDSGKERVNAQRDSTKTKHVGGKPGQDPALSLDASYAVEFFSAAPPPVHFDGDVGQEIERESRRVRTPEQIARQEYLRRLVIKFMVAAGIFVAIVVVIMWRRGLFRLLP